MSTVDPNDAFQDPFDTQIDLSEYFKTEEDVTKPDYAAEGNYHLQLQTVSLNRDRGFVELSFQILAGTGDLSEIGKMVSSQLWMPDPTKEWTVKSLSKRVALLTLALGLRQPGEMKRFHINEEWLATLQGRQLVGVVAHNTRKYTADDGKDVSYTRAVIRAMYPLGAVLQEGTDVYGCPLDMQAANEAGYSIAAISSEPASVSGETRVEDSI